MIRQVKIDCIDVGIIEVVKVVENGVEVCLVVFVDKVKLVGVLQGLGDGVVVSVKIIDVNVDILFFVGCV